MNVADLHPWPADCDAARKQQEFFSRGVILDNELPDLVKSVAGVDVSYEKHGDRFYAGIVVLSFPEFELIEEQTAVATVTFPYIPGLLSFRELPVLLDAFRKIRNVPEIILVDGQGIAHPRGLGLASHLGLWLDLPTIGCAKSRLCGAHAEPGPEKGQRADLLLVDKRIGQVVRTRREVKPMYISPGHKVDVETATGFVLQCCTRYRLPEPTRLAHHLTNRVRRGGDW